MDQAEKLRTIVKKNQQNFPKAQVFAVTSGNHVWSHAKIQFE